MLWIASICGSKASITISAKPTDTATFHTPNTNGAIPSNSISATVALTETYFSELITGISASNSMFASRA